MIVANKSKIILNTAVKGQPYKDSVALYNNGNTVINLTPWSSCLCTEAYLDRGIIKPGEFANLFVTYTPGASGMDEKQFGVGFTTALTDYKLIVTIIAKVI